MTAANRPPAVRLGFVGRPDTWWVETLEGVSPTEALVRRLTTRAVARPAEDGRPVPDLGTWRWAGDTLLITLDEVSWSDGRPVRAEDLASALERAGTRARFLPLVRAEAIGPRRVRLTFAPDTAPCPAATEALFWPLGEGVWPPARTLGPYRVAVASPSWQLRPRRPDDVEVLLVPFDDGRTLARAWTEGDVDLIVGDTWLYGRTPPPPPPSGDVRDLPGSALAALVFRLDHPVLGDPIVRRALALATDPAALAVRAYGAPLPSLTALLPPGHWAAPEAGVAVGDAAAAGQQLGRAGWRDRDGDGVRENDVGEPLALTLALPYSLTDARWEELGPLLAEQWRQVGVELTLSYQAPFSLRERLSNGQWDVALLVYAVGPDPDQQFLWAPPDENPLARDLNVMGYANEEVSRLMREAARVPGCLPEERARLYRQAWARIGRDAPFVPLFPLPVRLFVGERATPLMPWVSSALGSPP